jgi:hypothetical protein
VRVKPETWADRLTPEEKSRWRLTRAAVLLKGVHPIDRRADTLIEDLEDLVGPTILRVQVVKGSTYGFVLHMKTQAAAEELAKRGHLRIGGSRRCQIKVMSEEMLNNLEDRTRAVPMRCFSCGQPGHRKGEKACTGRRCRWCNKDGHFEVDCPAKAKGTPADCEDCGGRHGTGDCYCVVRFLPWRAAVARRTADANRQRAQSTASGTGNTAQHSKSKPNLVWAKAGTTTSTTAAALAESMMTSVLSDSHSAAISEAAPSTSPKPAPRNAAGMAPDEWTRLQRDQQKNEAERKEREEKEDNEEERAMEVDAQFREDAEREAAERDARRAAQRIEDAQREAQRVEAAKREARRIEEAQRMEAEKEDDAEMADDTTTAASPPKTVPTTDSTTSVGSACEDLMKKRAAAKAAKSVGPAPSQSVAKDTRKTTPKKVKKKKGHTKSKGKAKRSSPKPKSKSSAPSNPKSAKPSGEPETTTAAEETYEERKAREKEEKRVARNKANRDKRAAKKAKDEAKKAKDRQRRADAKADKLRAAQEAKANAGVISTLTGMVTSLITGDADPSGDVVRATPEELERDKEALSMDLYGGDTDEDDSAVEVPRRSRRQRESRTRKRKRQALEHDSDTDSDADDEKAEEFVPDITPGGPTAAVDSDDSDLGNTTGLTHQKKRRKRRKRNTHRWDADRADAKNAAVETIGDDELITIDVSDDDGSISMDISDDDESGATVDETEVAAPAIINEEDLIVNASPV